jgi:hypothetical protein
MKGADVMVTTKLRRTAAALLTAGVIITGAGLSSGPSPAAGKPAVPEKGRTAGERLTAADFERLHQKLTRMGSEGVWSIPWQLSVREGRALAARENKPLLLWCTNNGGTNPLGPC